MIIQDIFIGCFYGLFKFFFHCNLIFQSSGNQNITGIDVLNNYIDAPEKIRKKAKLEVELNAELRPFSIYLNNIRKTNSRYVAPVK